MRWCLTITLLVATALGVPAETFVYVSMGPEKKIQSFRLDPKDGKLTPVEVVAVEGTPGSLAVDPHKKFLFVALRGAPQLASLQLDPATGKLKPVSTAPMAKDEVAAYVSSDRSGRWLLWASYNAGKAGLNRLRDDGKIEAPAAQTVMTAKTAHAIVTDRDNRWVFVPTVAANAVFQYRFDAETGKLTDAGNAAGGKDNAGPRHLAFHPKLDFAFTSDETSSSITAYAFDPKTGLKPVQNLSSLPADFKGNNAPAEVKVHPGGKFVWITNRGLDSLAGFAIDGAGKLTALGQTPTEKNPRSFDIEPEGRYLIAAGEGSGKLTVYGVDGDTGKLTPLHRYEVGKSLGWVVAVKVGDK